MPSASDATSAWDAAAYDRISGPHAAMGGSALELDYVRLNIVAHRG